MKRTAVRAKRKSAGASVHRKPSRRRLAAKSATPARKRRSQRTPGKSAKAKPARPRRTVAKRKVTRRPRRALASREAVLSTEPEATVVPTNPPESESPTIKRPRKVAATRARRPSPRRAPKPIPPLSIPPILLEGDEPESPPGGGPGGKFVLGPESPAAHFPAQVAHLPTSYGTGKLFLTARDPHWLYAHWDIPLREQFQHNARSVDRHLILRLYVNEPVGKPVSEIHVHPESHHWFAPVEQAGAQFVGELGYYRPGRKWKSLATSAPMRTPPDTVSADATVEFATIPVDLSFEAMRALLASGAEPRLPLVRALQQLREGRRRELPATDAPEAWSPEQEIALAKLLASAPGQRPLRGSEESAGGPEVLPPPHGLPLGPGAFDLSSSFGEYLASPLGGGPPEAAFWFRINAELIIHGATEPNAQVSLGGKPIALQPDGSFSFRFALPDGQYELPVVAVSADHTDGRAAQLKFARSTETFGDVGTHPSDPTLPPPGTT